MLRSSTNPYILVSNGSGKKHPGLGKGKAVVTSVVSGPSPSPSNSGPSPILSHSSLSPVLSNPSSSLILLNPSPNPSLSNYSPTISIPNSSPTSNSIPNPSSSAVPAIPAFCQTCITKDTDTSLQYEGIWSFNIYSGYTTHSTTTPGSSVSFTFNGSGIVVFGIVPSSNATIKPPTAAYTLDTDSPVVKEEPSATSDTLNQMLFRSPQLSSHEHILNLTVQSADSPFILQYFYVFPPSSASQHTLLTSASSSPMSTQQAPPAAASQRLHDPHSTAKIVGGTLGSLAVLAVVILALFIFRRRRRVNALSISIRTHSTSSSPLGFVTSLRVSEFTTTESIMRSNASSLTSVQNKQYEPGADSHTTFGDYPHARTPSMVEFPFA